MADAYTPVDGLKNMVSFPTDPGGEEAARKQIQDMLDQILAFHNAHLADTPIYVRTAGADVDNLINLNLKTAEAVANNKSLQLTPGVYGISDYWVIPSGITIIFDDAEIKLLEVSSVGSVISNVWNGGGTETLFTENVTLINPKVDGNNISGENGFSFANCKNINIYNPQIKNTVFDAIKMGGRALQFEGGVNGVKDCNVYNPIIHNCSIGINAQGTASEPAININFFNAVMDNVDIPFNFDSTEIADGALSAKEMNIYIDGFSLRNCGRVTGEYGSILDGGIITVDRAYGIDIKNGRILNDDINYGVIGGLARGKGRNIKIENVEMVGSVVALFNGDPRGFGSASTGSVPAIYIAKNVRHFGTAEYVVKSYSPSPQHMINCTLENIEIDTVTSGILNENASFAANSYASIRRRSDGAVIQLKSFKSIFDGGNDFILENKEGFAQIHHVKTGVLDEIVTPLFSIDMPAYSRAFIEFFITSSFVESASLASAVAVSGVATAISDGTGVILSNVSSTLIRSTTETGTTQLLTVTITNDAVDDKIIFNVTQNAETVDVAETVMLYAKIAFTESVTPKQPKIILL